MKFEASLTDTVSYKYRKKHSFGDSEAYSFGLFFFVIPFQAKELSEVWTKKFYRLAEEFMEDAPTFNHERMKVLDSKLKLLLFSFLFFFNFTLSVSHSY